jgi:hypothetical protein
MKLSTFFIILLFVLVIWWLLSSCASDPMMYNDPRSCLFFCEYGHWPSADSSPLDAGSP